MLITRTEGTNQVKKRHTNRVKNTHVCRGSKRSRDMYYVEILSYSLVSFGVANRCVNRLCVWSFVGVAVNLVFFADPTCRKT